MAGLLLFSHQATADTLIATREQPMFEVAHTVDIKIADGVATYTVRRMFSNPGTVADQVELDIGLPYGAAATGLRIKANDRWYDGVLMEREAAARLFQEMTGYGQHQPKDPALLSWMCTDKLSLQVRNRSMASGCCARDAHRHGQPDVGRQPHRDPDRRQAYRSRYAGRAAPTVASALGRQQTYASAEVTLELPHTYKSDLHVDLLTPTGERIAVHAGSDRTTKQSTDTPLFVSLRSSAGRSSPSIRGTITWTTVSGERLGSSSRVPPCSRALASA